MHIELGRHMASKCRRPDLENGFLDMEGCIVQLDFHGQGEVIFVNC